MEVKREVETEPYIYGSMIYEKGGIPSQWRKDIQEIEIIFMENMKLTSYLINKNQFEIY